MLFNGQKFNSLSEKLSFNPQFFFIKTANICFLDKNVFERNFISNLSAVGNKPGLLTSKNTKHLKCLLIWNFYAFFKISHFT